MTEDLVGRLIATLGDRLRVERELGRGGMARVFLAHDLKHNRPVALKVLHPELAQVLGTERFEREIRLAARLQHPHILSVFDSGEDAGQLWFTMPYVPGESLRDRLTGERQLPVDDAMRIARQVAEGLDYAHRCGVVHRDVKPENILLAEGHALIADFGIARPMGEGEQSLTATGVAVGTPAYMSPEQASGMRDVDARTDVYALGCVLFEMLAGEPPYTGPTPQAIMARALTETPRPIHPMRLAVPAALDAVIAKATAATPADRFPSAAAFAKALEPINPGLPSAGQRSTPATRFPIRWAVAQRARLAQILLVMLLGTAAVVAWSRSHRLPGLSGPRRGGQAVLNGRVQLTSTGDVRLAAISPDGKQVAYATPECESGDCSYSIVLQDIGGSTTRQLLGDVIHPSRILWSPDRLNLLVHGGVDQRFGSWLISALGGPPRLVAPGVAQFIGGGDSLFVTSTAGPDRVSWARISPLDGVPNDSFPLAGPDDTLGGVVVPVPGSPWIIAEMQRGPARELQVLDRTGRERDRLALPPSLSFDVACSTSALWIRQDGPIVRVPLEARSGKLSPPGDTVNLRGGTNLSVTSDGEFLVADESRDEHSVWAVDFRDALRGKFAPNRRVAHSTSFVAAVLSPDGGRLLIQRMLGTAVGTASRYSVRPFPGGSELQLPIAADLPLVGDVTGIRWADSVTVALAEPAATGVRLSLMDVRTGMRRASLSIPDRLVPDFAPLSDGGWTWISFPSSTPGIRVQRAGETEAHTLSVPSWYSVVLHLSPSPNGERLAVIGQAATTDSMVLSVLSLADGRTTRWATVATGTGGSGVSWVRDRSILLSIGKEEQITYYRVRTPGQVERLGSAPRAVDAMSVSSDMSRAAVTVRDRSSDLWMTRLSPP